MAPCVCGEIADANSDGDSRVQLGIPSWRILDCTVGNGCLVSVGGVIFGPDIVRCCVPLVLLVYRMKLVILFFSTLVQSSS